MNGKETLKCNQIIYKEDLVKDPDFSEYIKDQLDSYVGGKIMSRLLGTGECICRAITKVEQFADINAINIMDTVQITKLIRCKDCKHRPKGTGANHDLEFPDYVCPCQCTEDGWYSWKPKDDWFCADGERREE